MKVSTRQVQTTVTRKKTSSQKEEKFHKPDKDQLPPSTKTYILTMLPEAGGDHVFNSGGKQEWEVQGNTDTTFAIYGT